MLPPPPPSTSWLSRNAQSRFHQAEPKSHFNRRNKNRSRAKKYIYFFEDCCLARHCQVCYLCCLCPFHTLLWGGYLMKHTLQTDTLRLGEAGLPGWGHKTKPRAFIDSAHTCLWFGLCSKGRQTVVSQTDLPLCSQER